MKIFSQQQQYAGFGTNLKLPLLLASIPAFKTQHMLVTSYAGLGCFFFYQGYENAWIPGHFP